MERGVKGDSGERGENNERAEGNVGGYKKGKYYVIEIQKRKRTRKGKRGGITS